MSEKQKQEIAEMVETAEYLAKKDPMAFALAKNSIDTLKARADMERKAAAGEPEKTEPEE